jgi:tetratricopeptide (TPR) repeat protein
LKGLIARQQKQLEQAKVLLEEALNLGRDLNDEYYCMVVNSLGELAYECKDYGVAEQYYREALIRAQSIDDNEGQAVRSGNLGVIALCRQEFLEAHKWFEQSLSLAEKVGRQDYIAKSYFGLARVHEAEGRADLALPLAQEALKIYERLQHRDLAEVRELVERLKGKVGGGDSGQTTD